MTKCICPGEGQDLPESQHMYECPMNPRGVTNEDVHKLIQPTPNGSHITDLILCWRHNPGLTAAILTTSWSKDINDVTCRDCLQLWVRGVYQ